MQNGPQLWDTILAALKPTFPSAVIAGGAVRDYLLGVEPKDIDVFVNANLTKLSVRIEDFDFVRMEPNIEYEHWTEDQKHPVAGVLDGHYLPTNIPVQLIGRPHEGFSAKSLVNDFDIGITQCWYDGDGVCETSACAADHENMTLTILRNGSVRALERSKERAARFNAREGNSYTVKVAA
jgi:hypothetical protein